MDRFIEKKLAWGIKNNNLLNGLVNAGVKTQDVLPDVEAKNLIIEKKVLNRTEAITGWFDEKWPLERIEKRYTQIIHFFNTNYNINAPYIMAGGIMCLIDGILEYESRFGTISESFLRPAHLVPPVAAEIEHCSWSIPMRQLCFGFDSIIRWFDIKEERHIRAINDLVKLHPDKSEQIIKDLNSPVIILPTNTPKVEFFESLDEIDPWRYMERYPSHIEMPDNVKKYIVSTRLSQSAELCETKFQEFKKAYNNAINTGDIQTIQDKCSIVPIRSLIKPNQIWQIAVKPLFDID